MRLAVHAAIGQVESGDVQIQRREIPILAKGVQGGGRERAGAVPQGGGETAEAVGVRGGFGQDVVVMRQQPQLDAGAGLRVGIGAHLLGQPVAATPDGRGEVGAQDYLHAAPTTRIGAIAGLHHQRIEAGTGRGERVRNRQGGAGRLVRLPFRNVRLALPDHAAGLVRQIIGVPDIDGIAQPGAGQEGSDIALGQPDQLQRDGGQVDGGEVTDGGLAVRQHEQASVEGDARLAVGHGDLQHGVFQQRHTLFRRQPGPQRDPRGGAGGAAMACASAAARKRWVRPLA